MRSTLISPTTRTRFAVPGVGTLFARMDGEALDDAPDGAGRRRRVRASADLQASEEGEELPDQRIDQRELTVVEGALALALDGEVLALGRELGRDPLADDEPPSPQSLAPQLQEHVPLEGADDGIAREEGDDQAVRRDGRH